MRVHIQDDIYLSSGGSDGTLGYKLERKRLFNVKGKEEKEVTYQILGNYSNFTNALNGFLNYKIDSSTVTNVPELLQEVKSIKEEIKDILGGI